MAAGDSAHGLCLYQRAQPVVEGGDALPLLDGSVLGKNGVAYTHLWSACRKERIVTPYSWRRKSPGRVTGKREDSVGPSPSDACAQGNLAFLLFKEIPNKHNLRETGFFRFTVWGFSLLCRGKSGDRWSRQHYIVLSGCIAPTVWELRGNTSADAQLTFFFLFSPWDGADRSWDGSSHLIISV